MSTHIEYEYPLNERTRTLLRLESYFSQATHFLHQPSTWDSQVCMSSLIELLNHLDRHDLRGELLKELERHFSRFTRLLQTPAIDHERLTLTLDELTSQIQILHGMSVKAHQDLRAYELLNIIRQRTTLLGTSGSFDIPAYHQWLHQSKNKRVDQLKVWLQSLSPLQEGIDLLLRIIRNSGIFEPKSAESGFYQRSFESQMNCHLVQTRLPKSEVVFPEVSGGKHRLCIRFLSMPSSGRPKQTDQTVNFDVCFCIL